MLETKNLAGQGWVNIFDEFDFDVGTPIIVHNGNTQYLYLSTDEDPNETNNYIRIEHNDSARVSYLNENAWVRCEGYVTVCSAILNEASSFNMVDLPPDLYTSDKPKVRRLRVEAGSNGFFGNNETRTYKEFDIPNNETWAIKVEVTDDIVLWNISLELVSGNVIFRTVYDDGTVTETEPFDNNVPMFRKNNTDLATEYPHTNHVTVINGGQFEGGVEIDRHRYKVSDNSNFASSVGERVGEERGVNAGTYYLEIESTGGNSALGILSAWWESSIFEPES